MMDLTVLLFLKRFRQSSRSPGSSLLYCLVLFFFMGLFY